MKKKLKINATVTTIAVLICVILLNVIIGIISAKMPLKIDLTREQVYEFSSQTKEVMKSLDKDIDVYAMYSDSDTDKYSEYVREYLSKYESLSDKFHVKYIDLYSDPTFVKKFEENGDEITSKSLVISCGDKFKVLSIEDLYYVSEKTNYVAIDMERKVTSALMNVTGRESNLKAYYTEGHDENACEKLKALLSEEGYENNSINLSMSMVPEDCSVLIIANASKEFTEEEIQAIDEYSDRNGQIMVIAEPGVDVPYNFAGYLARWGVTIENDFIIENDPNHSYRSQYGIAVPAPIMQDTTITKNLIAQKVNFASPQTRSITVDNNNTYYAQNTALLKTTEDSIGKTNLNTTTLEKEEGDNIGPLNAAIMSTKSNDDGSSNLFVLGSLTSIESVFLTNSAYANADFILNTLSFMTGSTDVFDIRAKQLNPEELTMSQAQMILIKIILYAIPIIIFIIGIVIWIKRRYK